MRCRSLASASSSSFAKRSDVYKRQVFLQLRPIPYTDFMTYLLVMACSLGFAVCCLLLSSYGHRREDDYALARKGIALLQEQLDAYLKQKTDQQRKEDLVNIQRSLSKQAYQSLSLIHI